MKLDETQLIQIGNAIREALATPEDKQGIELIVREVFEIKCVKCAHYIERSTVHPLALMRKEPYICSECCSVE